MKSILFFLGFIISSFFAFTATATPHAFCDSFSRAGDSSTFSALLPLYFDIKNALVKKNAGAASGKAEALLRVIKDVNAGSLSGSENKAFSKARNGIETAAGQISSSHDVAVQRNAFSVLSDVFYTLAKEADLSVSPVYRQYCPMQKKYWLSSEKEIRNPYYGSTMLTCGNVTEIID